MKTKSKVVTGLDKSLLLYNPPCPSRPRPALDPAISISFGEPGELYIDFPHSHILVFHRKEGVVSGKLIAVHGKFCVHSLKFYKARAYFFLYFISCELTVLGTVIQNLTILCRQD